MSNATALNLNESQNGQEHLTFMLAGDEYAVPIMRAREILEYHELTNVPMVPGYIRGAINLRGSVVPVVDLATKFGLPGSEITRRTCIVIMEVELDGEHMVMGIIVDKVLQVLEIPDTNIEPAPGFGAKIRTDFILGMGKIDDNFVIILDIDRVLSAEEIAVVSHAGETVAANE
jgi:purine-binding chemotaxis protein CheW